MPVKGIYSYIHNFTASCDWSVTVISHTGCGSTTAEAEAAIPCDKVQPLGSNVQPQLHIFDLYGEHLNNSWPFYSTVVYRQSTQSPKMAQISACFGPGNQGFQVEHNPGIINAEFHLPPGKVPVAPRADRMPR